MTAADSFAAFSGRGFRLGTQEEASEMCSAVLADTDTACTGKPYADGGLAEWDTVYTG